MKKEVNCRNAKAIFEYVKAYNEDDISVLIENLDPEIDSLNDPVAFLTNPKKWVSTAIVVKLFERARHIFHDDNVPYKIAKFAVENTAFGNIQMMFVKVFWSYSNVLKHLQKINDQWNRNKKVEVVVTNKKNSIVRLHWNPKMNPSKDICLFNQGVYTFMPYIWGGKPLTLREEYCYFEGAPYCEYHLRFPYLNRFHELSSKYFTPKSILTEIIEDMEEDKKIIEKQYEEVYRLNLELNRKIKQLIAAQDTGKAILSILNLDQLLTTIMNILSNICRINRAIIMLRNDKEECLEYIHGIGFNGEIAEEIKKYRVPIHRVSNILARVATTGRVEYIPDVRISSLRKDNILLTIGRPTSVYVVPLITRTKVIGIIATDAVDEKGVPKDTRATLEIFAPQIAIAIENARLYRELQDQMLELKRSRAMLSKAEKFSFLGNLAARLGHEIKGPMAAISRFIEMLPHKFDDEEFRGNFQKLAMEETEKVNDLILELLDLARTKEPKFELNDLHGLIEKMILLISPHIKTKRINIIRKYDSNIVHAWMDSEKIKETILNILSNAVEFTHDGGKIEIITKNIAEQERPHRIRVEIRDNGKGIPETVIDKIFDPYFTSKQHGESGNSSGLGLFIAHQNIEDLSGTVEVRSKVNEGTTFILTLPSYHSNGLSSLMDRKHEN